MKAMAPKREPHIIQLLDWIHLRYEWEKKETEERMAVSRRFNRK
jgi:translation initiation factor IF-3